MKNLKSIKFTPRYVYWVMESPQGNYVCPIFSTLNGFFNWTMTYRMDSDFPHPYGRVYKIKEHPEEGRKLVKFIKEFGRKNAAKYGSGKKEFKAAWFVSSCHSRSGREVYVDLMKKANLLGGARGSSGQS